NVTKEVQGDLPTTVGSHQVPVKVTYADGTEDTVNVPVDITETDTQKTDTQKYDPTVSAGSVSVNKDDVSTEEQKETLKTAIL
ncbi:hypothetical protein, partial [Streptococcus suis]